MQVKSTAECSSGSILQYFLPSLTCHLSLRSLFCLFLRGRLRQVLLCLPKLKSVNNYILKLTRICGRLISWKYKINLYPCSADSVDTDERLCYVAFHLCLHCLAKYPFKGFLSTIITQHIYHRICKQRRHREGPIRNYAGLWVYYHITKSK